MTGKNAVVLAVFTLAAGTALTAVAGVQWSAFGANRDDHFGRGVGLAGDLTGDGIEDFLVGAVGVDDWTGQVQVYDGATKTVITVLNGEGAGYRLGGRRTSANDFNNDGTPDVAIASVKWGPDQRGKVYVLSGSVLQLASPVFSVTGSAGDSLGDQLSGLDFNGDGIGDLLVSSPYNDEGAINAGKIQIFSGPNGQVIFSRIGPVAERSLGTSLSHGDINCDGYTDIIAGTFYPSGIGKAYVYSGAPGVPPTPMITLSGASSGDRFGSVVSTAGDFNHDGCGDFVVGAPGSGKMYIFAGPAGQLLATKSEAVEALTFMGDVNGDDYDDFAVGVPSYKVGGKRVGRITIYGGNSAGIGTLLAAVTGPGTDTDFGYYLAGGKQLLPGGWLDLLAGAPGYNRKGSVYVLSLF